MGPLIEGPDHVSRRYRSPVDLRSRILTTVVIATVVLASLLFGFMSRPYQLVSALFLAFSGVVLALAYTFRPIAYGMAGDGITIFFAWRRLRIPWESISAVGLQPGNKAFQAVRVVGSGGVFGELGRYWSPALGMHLRLVTDRGRVVVLQRKVPYCLSPDDPDRFVREAQEYLGTVEDGAKPRAIRFE
ncbi:MAG: PH domain-containing protein [Candidatus Eisenbacteria bacterium]